MEKQVIIHELFNIMSNDLDIEIEGNVNEKTELKEIGIDSIAMMALWVYVEERFGFETDEDALVSGAFRTIDDIGDYIVSRVDRKA